MLLRNLQSDGQTVGHMILVKILSISAFHEMMIIAHLINYDTFLPPKNASFIFIVIQWIWRKIIMSSKKFIRCLILAFMIDNWNVVWGSASAFMQFSNRKTELMKRRKKKTATIELFQ